MIEYEDGIAGQFYVKLKSEFPVVEHAADLVARYGGEILHTYEPVFNGFAVRGLDEAGARRLDADPWVERVEQDRAFEPPQKLSAPRAFFSKISFLARNLVSVKNNWALDRIDQANLPLDGQCVRPNLGAGVHVYVIDSGISDPDGRLFGARLGSGVSFINGGASTADCADHGTSVAAIIGSDARGVAPEVQIHPVRVWCGSGVSLPTVAAGVRWVAMHAQAPSVANISLAFPFSQSVNEIIANAATRLPIVVAAGERVGNLGPFDVSTVSPASVSEVITVAGSTLSLGHDARWTDSNFGSGVDIFAPSDAVDTYSASAVPRSFPGTSYASGMVCGAVAIFLHANPGATPAAVQGAIISSSTQGKISGRRGEPDRLLRI